MPEARTTLTTSTSSTPCAARPTGRRSDRPKALARPRSGRAPAPATGAGGRARRREGRLDWLGRRPDSGLTALPPLSAHRPLRAVRPVPLQDRDLGPGASPPGPWLPAHRCRPSRLDGPFRRDARGPSEPRCWFLGSGPSTFTSWWRERLIHRLGGLLPVWRGGLGVEGHVRSAMAVVDAGAVFVQMPEGTVNGPAGRLGPFRPGAALVALRTGATIVPGDGGDWRLYIGRRMASRASSDDGPRAARRDLGRHPPSGRFTRGAGASSGPARRSRRVWRRWSRRSTREPSAHQVTPPAAAPADLAAARSRPAGARGPPGAR